MHLLMSVGSTERLCPLTIEEYENNYRELAGDLNLIERVYQGGISCNQLRQVLWPYIFGLTKHRGRFVAKDKNSSSTPSFLSSADHLARNHTTATDIVRQQEHHQITSNGQAQSSSLDQRRLKLSPQSTSVSTSAASSSHLTSGKDYVYIEHEENSKRWRELEKQYFNYQSQWKSIQPEQELRFSIFRERKALIERDVVRSDRLHPFYADNSNNMSTFTALLMTYMMYDFDIGYSQGMSDLAAPILYVFDGDLVKSFWVFVEVMKVFRRNFESSQKTIHFQLNCLYRLIKLTDAKFAMYLKQNDCSNCFFAFRCIVCQFKRELMKNEYENDYTKVLNLWDTIWSVQRRHDLRSKSKFVHTYTIADGRSSRKQHRRQQNVVNSSENNSKNGKKKTPHLTTTTAATTNSSNNNNNTYSYNKYRDSSSKQSTKSSSSSKSNGSTQNPTLTTVTTPSATTMTKSNGSLPNNISNPSAKETQYTNGSGHSTHRTSNSQTHSNGIDSNSNNTATTSLNIKGYHINLYVSQQNGHSPTNHTQAPLAAKRSLPIVNAYDTGVRPRVMHRNSTLSLASLSPNSRLCNGTTTGSINGLLHRSYTNNSPSQYGGSPMSLSLSPCSLDTDPVKQEQVVYTKETFYSSFDPNQADVPRFELSETEKFVLALCLSMIRRERNLIINEQLDASEIHQHFINPPIANELDHFIEVAYQIYHYLNTDCDLPTLVKGADQVGCNDMSGNPIDPVIDVDAKVDEVADTYELLKDYFIISPTSYNTSARCRCSANHKSWDHHLHHQHNRLDEI